MNSDLNVLTFFSGDQAVRISAHELEPKGPQEETKSRPAIVLLHGSGGNTDRWSARLGPVLQAADLHLYAPHYFERTGTQRADQSTITDGVHVPLWLETIQDSLRFVRSRPGVDPNHVILAGISLGGFLALALASNLSSLPEGLDQPVLRAVIEVSGGLVPPYDRQVTARFPPTLILHGADDAVVPVNFAHRLESRLAALAVPHHSEILPGEGHWFSPAALPRMLVAVSSFLQPLLT